jgi:hypothetical protein
MCTMISRTTPVAGAAKGHTGWFDVTHACVGFDHATHGSAEHMVLLDFLNRSLGPSARVGVELDLPSARALLVELQTAIDAAEATGLT